MAQEYTYRQLRERLNELSDAQLDSIVTVHVPSADAYYPATLKTTRVADVVFFQAGAKPVSAETIYERLSDYGVLLLYGDIDLDERCWRFDEQQADPIHRNVRIAQIIAEYNRRGLQKKAKRSAAMRWAKKPGRKSEYFWD